MIVNCEMTMTRSLLLVRRNIPALRGDGRPRPVRVGAKASTNSPWLRSTCRASASEAASISPCDSSPFRCLAWYWNRNMVSIRRSDPEDFVEAGHAGLGELDTFIN